MGQNLTTLYLGLCQASTWYSEVPCKCFHGERGLVRGTLRETGLWVQERPGIGQEECQGSQNHNQE